MHTNSLLIYFYRLYIIHVIPPPKKKYANFEYSLNIIVIYRNKKVLGLSFFVKSKTINIYSVPEHVCIFINLHD